MRGPALSSDPVRPGILRHRRRGACPSKASGCGPLGIALVRLFRRLLLVRTAVEAASEDEERELRAGLALGAAAHDDAVGRALAAERELAEST